MCILLTLLHLGIKNILLGPSLPAFLSAFIGNKQLTQQEADELRRMIDKFEEEHHG